MRVRLNLSLALGLVCHTALAHNDLEIITVQGRHTNLIGEAVSASEGLVGQQEIELRPLLRTGEILEFIPGMVATQHSGTGKANQYFLRGFNLDHGTDFSTHVDNMPVNMRTHGHGQGYTDINFIIPEAVGSLEYKKGAYYSEIGDFSGAGSAQISTLERVNQGLVSGTLGEDAYYRLLALESAEVAGGDLLFAFETNQYDGPWSNISEDLDKINVLLKHTQRLDNEGYFSVAFMGYDSSWNSADQIPLRAVEQGIIDELGSIDETVGGETSRYSINAIYKQGPWQASAYYIDYSLNLWSNFTYFLDNPVNGDQFEQVDNRAIYGGELSYVIDRQFSNIEMSNRFGGELRIDDIDEVGLYQTQARTRLGATRSDQVEESSVGLFWENRTAWNHHFRSVFGVRYDYYDFNVKDLIGVNANGIDLSRNSGNADDDLISVKGSVIYAFDNAWEAYISAGQGFHSNDARGTTTVIDPTDGNIVETVDPLVKSFGYEAGVRGFISDKLNASMALWALELDSELLFVGDAGNTEASFGSERKGVELTSYYQLSDVWNLDFEYAYTDAKFSDTGSQGNLIPGAIKHVFQAGVNFNFPKGWFGSLRTRYFGDRPLIEDGSVESDASTIFNLRLGYRKDNWRVKVDVLNLTDSDDHDIDYFYASRLPIEDVDSVTEDIHYHVIEPRTIRLSLGYQF